MEPKNISLFASLIKILEKKIGLNLSYLFNNSLWIIGEQVIGMITGITITVLFTRLTTKDIFGQYQYVLSIFTLISFLSIPGIKTSVLRSIAQGYEGTYQKGTKISFLWSLIGIPILLMVAGYYYFFEQKASIGISLLLASLFFPFYYGLNTWESYLQAKAKFNRYSIYSITISLAELIALCTALFINKNSLPVIFLAAIIVNSILQTYFYFKIKRECANKNTDEGWIRQGFILTTLTFVSNSYNYIDKLIIGIFLSMEQLALYAIAVVLNNKIRILFKTFNRIIFPKIVKLDLEQIFLILKAKLNYIIFFLSIFCAFIYLVTPYIIRILYSREYNESIYYTQLYILTLPFAYFTSLFSSIFVAIKKENILTSLQIYSLTINVLLYIILIPLLGVPGAILSSIIYFMIFSIVSWYKIAKLYKTTILSKKYGTEKE